MSIIFVDSSAFARCYMADEPEHESLRTLLLGGENRVLGSQLANVEVPHVLAVGRRSGRLSDQGYEMLLAEFARHTAVGGLVALLRLRPAALRRARELVLEHRVRTLDALHLAVADVDGRRLAEPEDELVFVTRDADQRRAAEALGLATA